ncbi:sulfurtransferase FdhD [Psychrobacter sp. Choline-02u-13]|nr:formate dehydrogenase accessory sulfurtransferase FdhD [Psychrobacter sp. Urea-trap-18]MBA6284957.1 formate dehydrogenase accessory sulfurtransferase FdhD [Psychrobacter sp. Urea-trap-16]MBA6318806.1 formate dehydrogenase accessory sulfurtransferase FdhD [Psychrobacter sp. Urea-trap-20]MBA6333115.1 formate dehydrogenase accessory sulfurtransferase FdhD [Psychrobacter sp. Urea-trap-19]OEH69331.1 MAG: formate dehydrogenase family accessory protein FdhD [Psychrobacter sp. B29-1]PKG61835.1 sulf
MATERPNDNRLSETPLARSHEAHKHSYPSHAQDGSDKPSVRVEDQHASLAVEAAVSIIINGIHYAVLMASPHQLEYLAIGFLFSEGLIQYSHELLDWEVTHLTDIASYQKFAQDSSDESFQPASIEQSLQRFQDYDIYVVELVLSQRCHQRIQAQKRQLAGRTGCGMCGITGLTQALPDLSTHSQDHLYHEHNRQTGINGIQTSAPSLDSLLALRQQVDAAQHTHQLTGAVHAAATIHNQQLHLFEDVGRHNALDKLIGWQLRQKADVSCVLMTSRLSIELVQKSIRSQIPWLVGMSAPTSTAVRVAERYGLGLAGFLRDNRVTYYTKQDNI